MFCYIMQILIVLSLSYSGVFFWDLLFIIVFHSLFLVFFFVFFSVFKFLKQFHLWKSLFLKWSYHLWVNTLNLFLGHCQNWLQSGDSSNAWHQGHFGVTHDLSYGEYLRRMLTFTAYMYVFVCALPKV